MKLGTVPFMNVSTMEVLLLLGSGIGLGVRPVLRWTMCLALAWLGMSERSLGQWLTQSIELRPGWNAVQLHVDPSHAALDEIVGMDASNPIEEVWLWTPAAGVAQFTQTPQVPTASVAQWTSWRRGTGAASELRRLPGNAACLVRMANVGTNYTFRLLGRPVPPRNRWTSTGLNFMGMPTPDGASVGMDAFLAPAPGLMLDLQVYRYNGGELDAGNPSAVYAYRTTAFRRGEAFWLKAGTRFNRYFGPVDVELSDPRGVVFGGRVGEQRVRLRNRANRAVVVRLAMVASEPPPAGQPAIAGVPRLLLRGALNTTNLSFAHTLVTTTAGAEWALAADGEAGSDVELVFGLDRYASGGIPGDMFAGVLRFTDSLGLSQVDVPVSAEAGTWSGLWVGEATISSVRHALARYARDASGAAMLGPDGRPVRMESMNAPGSVARPFGFRVLVQVEGEKAFLLQRAYLGLKADATRVVALHEAALNPATLASARRISSVHFPWTESNEPWAFEGAFVRGGVVEARVHLGHDDHRSSPFLHAFHPDHDNLDATFSRAEPRGRESWDVERRVRIRIRPPGEDFRSLVGASDRIDGLYEETLTFSGVGSEARIHDVSGTIVLRRVSDVPVLTRD